MRTFVVALLIAALAFLIGATTGCWVYLECVLVIAALVGLGMLIYPLMAPRPHNAPTRWHRFHGWWSGTGNTRGHAGQVLMTLGVMAAIAMVVWGLFVLAPRIPSCAGAKACATATPTVTSAPVPVVQAPNAYNHVFNVGSEQSETWVFPNNTKGWVLTWNSDDVDVPYEVVTDHGKFRCIPGEAETEIGPTRSIAFRALTERSTKIVAVLRKP